MEKEKMQEKETDKEKKKEATVSSGKTAGREGTDATKGVLVSKSGKAAQKTKKAQDETIMKNLPQNVE